MSVTTLIARGLAAALLLCAATAQAQYTNSMTGRSFNNMYAANADRIMSQMIQQAGYQAMRSSIEASVKKNAAAGGGATAAQAPAKVAYKLPITATDFKPAGTRNVPEQLAAQVPNAAERAQVVAAGKQILKTIEATPGFRKNNVAAAMTVIVGVSIQVLKGTEIPDAESEAMMRALNDQLGATESFKSLPAADRTRMYDTFVVIGGFIAGIAQAGAEKNDAALQEQARTMARDALAQFGAKV